MSDDAEDVMDGIVPYYEEGERELKEAYGNDPAVDLDLNYDQEIINCIKRPVFMVRGKKITHEQSIQVLALEPLFQGWDKNDLTAVGEIYNDRRYSSGALGDCFFTHEGDWDWLSSWLLSDGTIGGNSVESLKFPELWEILPRWAELAKACPFLDMAVGYTIVDQSMCFFCKYSEVDHETGDYYDGGIHRNLGPEDEHYHMGQICVEECRRRKELLKTYAIGAVDRERIKPADYEFYYAHSFNLRCHHKEMHKLVRGCFIIRNGHISMYWGDAGRDRFKEYYDRYNDPCLDGLYGQQITSTQTWHIWSRNDVIDAFALRGLPAKCYDIAVQNGFIKEIPADAPVLTAEWLRKAHREMCRKWNIPIE